MCAIAYIGGIAMVIMQFYPITKPSIFEFHKTLFSIMELNWFAILGAALVPLAVGFVWYHPKAFGNAWMKAAGVSPESASSGNMPLIFGLTLLLGLFLAFALQGLVIHQFAIFSLVADFPKADGDVAIADFMSKYGTLYRTFKHGVFHGVLAGLFFALPLLGVNALFERKGFKYIAINVGYWMVTMGIMGGIICQWA